MVYFISVELMQAVWVKEWCHFYSADNFEKCRAILVILLLLNSEMNYEGR